MDTSVFCGVGCFSAKLKCPKQDIYPGNMLKSVADMNPCFFIETCGGERWSSNTNEDQLWQARPDGSSL